MNCGRCGRQLFKLGQAICESCKKTMSNDATKNSKRIGKREDEQTDMFMNIVIPGKDEDKIEQMRSEHYTDTHDASAVWAEDPSKGRKKKRR